jgi:hypothetical protein
MFSACTTLANPIGAAGAVTLGCIAPGELPRSDLGYSRLPEVVLTPTASSGVFEMASQMSAKTGNPGSSGRRRDSCRGLTTLPSEVEQAVVQRRLESA